MDPSVKQLWNYYKAAAERWGEVSETPDAPPRQAAYSLYEFYQAYQSPEELNGLTRAFLGDRSAPRVREELPDPAGFFLEGAHPLNQRQAEAVRRALANDISFIQGPPGAGKTETILNLACCIGRMGRTAAIVSSNNSALTNIREKIGKMDGTLENQGWLKRHFAPLGRKSCRVSFGKTHPDFRFANARREPVIRAEDFLREFPIITSTIHSLKNCFQDGLTYCYDYVIMDETSQVDPVTGLAAMTAARRLVLVGDPEQLPPVITREKLRDLEDQALPEDLRSLHGIREERSFLDVCREVFDPPVWTFLKEHYRCHPGIIEFCKREIYREESLEIRTPDYDRSVPLPIRMLWFEGNYCERCTLETGGGRARRRLRSSKRNRKQVEIFLWEEWPRLWERLQTPGPPSVCILTPFWGQAKTLRDALREDIARRGGRIAVHMGDRDRRQGEGPEVPMLTIHKSQGREYDVVYLLPVEDGSWEWPWSQKKRLVNVAVSRAKKELRLILSTALMERSIQEALTGGRYVPPAERPGAPTEGMLCLQKLVSYAWNAGAEAGVPLGEYGFHPASLRSIYDRSAWLRARRAGEERGDAWSRWAPEACVEQALLQVLEELRQTRGIALSYYTNVQIQDLRTWEGRPLELTGERWREVRDLVRHGGHFDFVICHEERILLVIEADGGFHRGADGRGDRRLSPEEQAERERRDRNKDRLVREFFQAVCCQGNRREALESGGTFAFLRLPNDGTSCLETRALWSRADGALREAFFPLEELIEAQLDRTDFDREGGAFRLPAQALSALLREWDRPEKPAVGGALDALTQRDLLCRRYFPPLEREMTVPTEQGGAWGIVKGCQFSQEREGYFYLNPVYPESAGRYVRAWLAQTLPALVPLADQPIQALLAVAFDFFQAHISRAENPAAELRRLNRDTSFSRETPLPRYEDPHVQELYQLRYAYGFAYEYKQLFLSLLERTGGDGALTVTSLGCRSMVDYWALRAALESLGREDRPVDYTGVDRHRWSELLRVRACPGDTAGFVWRNPADYLCAAGRESSEIYVFPRSLSELDGPEISDGPELRGLCQGLEAVLRRDPREEVHLLFSLRRRRDPPEGESGCYPEDLEKYRALRAAVAAAGYEELTAEPEAFATQPLHPAVPGSTAIYWQDGAFVYPAYITDALESYGAAAGGIWLPMTTTRYLCYKAVSFRRRAEG